MEGKTIHHVLVIMWMYHQVCSKHPWRSNIQKKGHGKTSTTILKASCQKHRSWQLYNNEENGLQQFQMESCQPVKRLKDKKITKLYLTLILLMWRIWWAPNNASRWQMGFNSVFKRLIHINTCKMIPFQYEFLLVGAQSSCSEKVLELACFICLFASPYLLFI